MRSTVSTKVAVTVWHQQSMLIIHLMAVTNLMNFDLKGQFRQKASHAV